MPVGIGAAFDTRSDCTIKTRLAPGKVVGTVANASPFVPQRNRLTGLPPSCGSVTNPIGRKVFESNATIMTATPFLNAKNVRLLGPSTAIAGTTPKFRTGKVPFHTPVSGSATRPLFENTRPSENSNAVPPSQKPLMTFDCVIPFASRRNFVNEPSDTLYRVEALAPNSIGPTAFATFGRGTPLSKTVSPPINPLANTSDCGLPGTTSISAGAITLVVNCSPAVSVGMSNRRTAIDSFRCAQIV